MRSNGKIQLYPCLRLVIMLMIGIMIGKAMFTFSSWHLWCCGCVGTLILTLFLREKITQTILIFLSTICLGTMVTQHKLASLAIDLPEGKVEYEAIIMSQPIEKGKVVRCDLLVTNGIGSSPVNVKATILKDTFTGRFRDLRPGDGIVAYGTVEKPRRYLVGGNFDYLLWLQAHGIVARTFVTCDDWMEMPTNIARLNVWQRVQVKALILRNKLLERLYQSGIDGQTLAVVAAMSLGEKSMINQQTRDDYAVTGAAHVLALSGLHLGILFQIIILLAGRGRRRLFSIVLSLLVIWAYAILVGLPVSVIRAAVMISVYSFVSLLRRDSMSVNSLSVAAFMILLGNPLYLYDISFQLSFMAVLSILIYYPMFYRQINIQWLMAHRLVRWAWSLFTVSLSAQIGTLPIVVYYFGRISCYSLIVNFVAIPAATLVLYLAFVTIVCNPIGYLCQLTGKLLAIVAQALNESLRFIATLPGASIDNVRITFTQLVLLYVVIAAVTLLYSKISSTVKSSTVTLSSFTHGL